MENNLLFKNFKKHAPVLVIFGISLLFFATHYEGGALVLRGDTAYPLAPFIVLKKHSYAWFETYMMGQPAGQAMNFIFPLLPLIYLLNLLFNPSLSQTVLFTGLMFFSGVLPYIFLNKINKGEQFSNMLGALFYMLNTYIVTEWYVPNPWFLLAYISLPLIAIACYYLVTNFPVGVFCLTAGYFLIVSSFANSPLIVVNFITGVLVILYLCIREEICLKRRFLYLSSYTIIFILANFWWLGLLLQYRNEGVQLLSSSMDVIGWARLSSRRSHLLYIFLNQFTPVIAGQSLFYTRFITNHLLAWLYAIFPIIIFSSLLRKNKEKHFLYVLAALLVVAFFVKGTQAPFGFIYEEFLKKIPYFAAFKTPPEKFGMLYVFLTAIALALTNTTRKLKYSALGILLIFSYPVYSGRLFPEIKTNSRTLKAYQKVDASYYKVSGIINKDRADGRVLLLPASGNYQTTYLSSRFRGLDWTRSLVQKPFIEGFDLNKDNLRILFKNISDEKQFTRALELYKVEYIILNRDIDKLSYGFTHKEDIDEIQLRLNAYKRIKKIHAQGPLVLYKYDAG